LEILHRILKMTKLTSQTKMTKSISRKITLSSLVCNFHVLKKIQSIFSFLFFLIPMCYFNTPPLRAIS